MKKKSDSRASFGWQEWTGLVVGIGVVLTVAGILSPQFLSFIESSATAAWVQGVGVLLAVWMTLHNQRTSERRRRQERVETIRVIVTDCEHVMRLLRLGSFVKGEHLAMQFGAGPTNELRLTVELLGSLDVYDFPNSTALRHFLKLRSQVEALSEKLRHSTGMQWNTPEGVALRRLLGDEAEAAERLAGAVRESLLVDGQPLSA